MSGLSVLTYLDFRNNRISDLSPLSGLNALVQLELGNNQISNLSSLSGLAALQRLLVTDQAVSAPAATAGVPVPNPVKNVSGNAVSLSDYCVYSDGCASLRYPTAGDDVTAAWNVDGSGQSPLIYFSGTLTRDVKAAFKVAFVPGDGAEGAPFTENVPGGDTLTLPEAPADFEKEGYKFAGWMDESAAQPALLQPGIVLSPTGDTTFTAQWERLPAVLVSFDAGGGTGAPAPFEVTEGESMTIPTTVPTRDGYKFTGWIDLAATEPALLQVGSVFTPTGDVTLTAQWAEVLWVSFDAGGGEGAPSTVGVVKGDSMTIPTTIPARDGYKFLGWKDPSAMGSVLMEPGVEYVPPFSVVLLAQWEKITVSGGSGGASGATGGTTGGSPTTGGDVLPFLAGGLVLTLIGAGALTAARTRERL